jgi:hypothetical protein
MVRAMTDMPAGTSGFEAIGEVDDDDWERAVEPVLRSEIAASSDVRRRSGSCVTVLIIGMALGLVACGGGSGGGTSGASASRTPPEASRTPGAGAAPTRTSAATSASATATRSRTPTTATATPTRTARAATPTPTKTARPPNAAATPSATATPRPTVVVVAQSPTAVPSVTAATTASDSSTPWGWIVAGVAAVAALAVGAVALARRSRRRKVADRWRSSATDAYGQAALIDDLAVREPPGSPELHRRIDDARATFYALASSGPDLPSMQAAHMVYAALGELDTALRARRPPADPSATPPVAGPEESTIGEARGELRRALAQLGTLLGIPAFPG